MFFSLLFLGLFSISPINAFWPAVTIKDCPNISAQKGIQPESFVGPWRLAYVFIDETYEEINEDNTCGVVEIVQVNDTNLAVLMMIDEKVDDFTIDRYTKELDIMVLSPGEWLLATPFQHLEFIHITVISLSRDHLILTFCAAPYVPEKPTTQPYPDQIGDHESHGHLNPVERSSLKNIFKSHMYKESESLSERMQRLRRVRHPSILLRGRRNTEKDEEFSEDIIGEKLEKYLAKHQNSKAAKKHLWTAVLVKNNNVSALKFVENASLLMKYGFNLTDGQLVSFGSCNLAKK